MPKNLADIFEALLGSLFLFRLEFEDPINLLKNFDFSLNIDHIAKIKLKMSN
jgi:hypothetical protein